MAAEPTSAAATAAAAASTLIAAPVLAGFGIDLTTVVAAALGVVVVQTLLPANKLDLRVLAGISIGSVIFSSLATPWLELFARDNVPYFKDLRDWHAHALVAAFAGGFAQPLLLLFKAALGKFGPTGVVAGPPAGQGQEGSKP